MYNNNQQASAYYQNIQAQQAAAASYGTNNPTYQSYAGASANPYHEYQQQVQAQQASQQAAAQQQYNQAQNYWYQQSGLDAERKYPGALPQYEYYTPNYNREMKGIMRQYNGQQQAQDLVSSTQYDTYAQYNDYYQNNADRYRQGGESEAQSIPQHQFAYNYNNIYNPYSEFTGNTNLKYNDFDSYVRPLENQEMIRSERHTDPYENAQAYNEEGYAARQSPVQTHGLQTISTVDVGRPLPKARKLRKQRNREERELRIPKGNESDLRPIRTRKRHAAQKALNKLKRERRRSLHGVRDIMDRTPKPERVRSRWDDYQGGATWEDINRYRDYELEELKYLQKQQDDMSEYYYYY